VPLNLLPRAAGRGAGLRGVIAAGFRKVGMGGVLWSSGRKEVLLMEAGVVGLRVLVRSLSGVSGASAEVVDLPRHLRALLE